MPNFITIERIDGKDVTFVKMDHLKSIEPYVNAYVYIDNVVPSEDYETEVPYVTYQRGNVLGIDTAHSFNNKQTFEQKYESARDQIKDVISFFKKEGEN